MSQAPSAGAQFRAALAAESPLQVMGAITAYAGMMAKRSGYKALYLSGGGVAANSLGMPDLGISSMEDVLIDARRIVDATGLPFFHWSTTGGDLRVAHFAALHIMQAVPLIAWFWPDKRIALASLIVGVAIVGGLSAQALMGLPLLRI